MQSHGNINIHKGPELQIRLPYINSIITDYGPYHSLIKLIKRNIWGSSQKHVISVPIN